MSFAVTVVAWLDSIKTKVKARPFHQGQGRIEAGLLAVQQVTSFRFTFAALFLLLLLLLWLNTKRS